MTFSLPSRPIHSLSRVWSPSSHVTVTLSALPSTKFCKSPWSMKKQLWSKWPSRKISKWHKPSEPWQAITVATQQLSKSSTSHSCRNLRPFLSCSDGSRVFFSARSRSLSLLNFLMGSLCLAHILWISLFCLRTRTTSTTFLYKGSPGGSKDATGNGVSGRE